MSAVKAHMARMSEVLEALIDVVGAKAVTDRIEARRKERGTRAIVANENEWRDRVAAGEAHPVKVVSETSYIFGRAPGDKPVCGPVTAVAARERKALTRARVGGTCKINGQPTVILAAYEDGPAPGKAARP